MEKNSVYTSGEFARRANVTLRTIRFYDQKNVLKPSFCADNRRRYYTDGDLAKLQQILLLKYLGFSLDEIREIILGATDWHVLKESLLIQKKLVQERIMEMQAVLTALDETESAIEEEKDINWNHMLNLIHLTAVDQSLKSQYLNASNIQARIRLHKEFSVNQEGWFHWIFRHCGLKNGMKVLEVGCGSGALWTDNLKQLPNNIEITVSDISEGMVHDAQRAIGEDHRFHFQAFDLQAIPFEDNTFDIVIANHVLFYFEDPLQACREIHRVLKPGGTSVISTYGRSHMREITELVQGFSKDIILSKTVLYETFGLENGKDILGQVFSSVAMQRYEDSIELKEAEPLIAYTLSCHGNQNHILLDRYREFHEYVAARVKNGFHITRLFSTKLLMGF